MYQSCLPIWPCGVEQTPRLCIHLVLSSKWEALISFLAIVCSSWVPVNRGSTSRSILTPLGDENFVPVRKGNKMVSRPALKIKYIILKTSLSQNRLWNASLFQKKGCEIIHLSYHTADSWSFTWFGNLTLKKLYTYVDHLCSWWYLFGREPCQFPHRFAPSLDLDAWAASQIRCHGASAVVGFFQKRMNPRTLTHHNLLTNIKLKWWMPNWNLDQHVFLRGSLRSTKWPSGCVSMGRCHGNGRGCGRTLNL